MTPRETHPPTSTRLHASGGLQLAADLRGDATHPPVLFLHGAGQSRRAWDHTAHEVAAAGWHTITIDHRGHGDSDWPKAADYDFDHFADDLDAVIDQLDNPPIVIGASLGGMTALLTQARTTRQRFHAVVLVDVTPRMEIAGVQRIVGFMTANPTGFDTLDQASDVIAAYTGRPKPANPDGLRQVLREDNEGRWRWHWDIRFLDGRADMILDADTHQLRQNHIRDRLHDGARNITVPTLVIRGAHSDLVSPEAVKEFVDAVPGSTYIDIADAGHMVAGDQNDHFTSAVLNFLRDLPEPPRGASKTTTPQSGAGG